MISVLITKFAAIAALGWLLPVLAAGAGSLVTLLFGGDGWLALIAGAGVAGFVFVWSRFGLKPALALLLAIAAVFIDQRAAQRGAAKQKLKEKQDADRAVDKAGRARADADRRNADAERLRDDDGFRRD